jgi:hypothetical protein
VAPVTPETVADLMAGFWVIADAFLRPCTAPLDALLAGEDGCGPAPPGTAGAGPATPPAAPPSASPAPAAAAG